ncbi:SMI1/KNR4 family protein [Stenotrophomonas sp.]|uniref:SMI1/KNR4 family protein n=1 Tax=Stenotrophomonas sp. TaxID=69392 RepID=UPI002D298C64|nr:SMI1/KNR4 family protein [Stenotrophomonas sp.]HYQ24952.1 SMI1/KNR4 family protein [Stenotrophomonas sp.]
MSTLIEIEQATGQAFPPLFHQITAEGRADWGATGNLWFREVFPTLLAQPPLLLHANEFEPIALHELREAWEDLTAEDHYNPLREDLQLLPFARSGAGDTYCFWSNAPGFIEPPVLMVWHDDDRADVLAANLQDFLFRKMVEAVTELEAAYTTLVEGDLAANLQAWLGSHRGWLRDDQAAALEALFARTDDIAAGRISDEEAQALVTRVIGFPRLDESFAYVRT